MTIINLDLADCLSSTEYNPSPHRVDPNEKPVSERMRLPIVYVCENCDYNISFALDDFKKHNKSIFTNLKPDERMIIVQHIKDNQANSFLDFYCPKCQQPTTIIFNGGDSGYWGEYFFSIDKVLVIKK